jgi:hypothetical protein
MAYSSFRLSLAAVLTVAITACSGAGTGLAPSPHRDAAGAKTTPATFTIKWTNASAPASVRRKDTISPSAQSVSVLINGTTAAVANRTSQPTQSIALQAPVGTDVFTFFIYDLPNAQGTLLGSATVTQLIVDGAANTVTAVIQAICAQTNIQFVQSANAGPTVLGYSSPSGSIARSLTSIELVGNTPETLQVGPEDADGNVIISGTGGTIPYTFSGSTATITPLNGANLQLTPLSSTPTSAAGTLTASAPSCPSAQVAITSSPAIYAEEAGNNVVMIFDWHGTLINYVGVNAGDVLFGYVDDDNWLLGYNKTTGSVTHYGPMLQSAQAFETAETNSVVAFTNDVDDTICADPSGGYTYVTLNCASPLGTLVGSAVAIATPTLSQTSGISGDVFVATPSTIFGLAWYNGVPFATASSSNIVSLATDDRLQRMYVFRSTSPYAVQYSDQLTSPVNESWFTTAPGFGATDTDNDDVYVYGTNGVIQASTSGGVALSGFNNGYGAPAALVVVSVNEH